jgi:muramoyltetrapeptide carboxypeptidase
MPLLSFMKAKALHSGDLIGIIAPASAPRPLEKISKSVEYFERLGYRVELGKHIAGERGYLAGSDKDRLADFHDMIRNKKVKAIFFIRGGYGTMRLVPEIDYELIKKNPKIIVGYSDATAIFHAIYKKTGSQSLFFGPMPGVDIWNGFDAFAEECMWRALTSNKSFGDLPSAENEIQLFSKRKFAPVEARMIGGNLAVFSAAMGTPYMPSLKDRILFFEDVGEYVYKLDRYFAQLRSAGVLDTAKAILLGQFTDCNPKNPSLSIDEMFGDYFGKIKIPVLYNLPFGHIPRQWTVPLGVKMNVAGSTISITESVLE